MTNARGIGMTSQRTRDRMIARLREKGIADEQVLGAMSVVPRHLFVEEALASRAYEDTALPIGFEQTISQPFTVARMIEVARNGRDLGRVLEVGTGCGYAAAVLARIAKEVYSIERIAPLLEKARANLRPLRISNLRLSHGDGYKGLPEVAPFDAIVVAAAAPEVPQALKTQLAVGGRMVLPLGVSSQQLILVERTQFGFNESSLDAVRFVPMRMGKQ
ncbi:MAG: protein-L-isoaspartate O-methyltransferase [Proteobacteria bacterium]|jgi:protein-L-isoaspartate(D-aspartate) O-methyltransferase|nr:protein-L-isoaspartate O-methyltransferase [Pseudomonadota bacterium]